MPEPPHVTATRAAYDTVAVDYGRLLRAELAAKPLDRALLATFAELVAADQAGPVVEVGCGPGRVTAHLHDLGLPVSGIDLSPGMVAVARAEHPHLTFEVGTMTALPIADGALGGLVAWYSIIHTPPEELPSTFDEFRRVLAPGGQLLLAFQVGDERVHLDQAYGHRIELDAYRLSLDRVVDQLGRAGLPVQARLLREPVAPERTRQGYLMAAKPAASPGTPP